MDEVFFLNQLSSYHSFSGIKLNNQHQVKQDFRELLGSPNTVTRNPADSFFEIMRESEIQNQDGDHGQKSLEAQ